MDYYSPATEGERTAERCDWAFVWPSTQASTVVVVFPSVNRSSTIRFLGMLWTLNWNHCCYKSCFLFVLVGVLDLFFFSNFVLDTCICLKIVFWYAFWLLVSMFALFMFRGLFFLTGYACIRKNGFLLWSGLLVSILASLRTPMSSFYQKDQFLGGFLFSFLLYATFLLSKPLRPPEKTTCAQRTT